MGLVHQEPARYWDLIDHLVDRHGGGVYDDGVGRRTQRRHGSAAVYLITTRQIVGHTLVTYRAVSITVLIVSAPGADF